MVYATTLHSPIHNAQPGVWDPGKQDPSAITAESWNDAEIKAIKGVLAVVKLPNGLAMVADHFETAKGGRDALKVKWAKAKAEGFNSDRALGEYVRIHNDPNAQVVKLEKKGDVKAAFAGAAKTYKAEFRSDYGYHAQMEPLNAVVRINDAGDKVEVWEGSQSPDESRKAVAKALGLKNEQVDIHQCYMGGGFGRRWLGDYAAECARIAKEVRRPVKLIWTREEDIAHGMFRPQSFQCLEAATDASGKVDRLEALRGRRRRVPADHRHQDAVLRHAEPVDRAARRVARHQASSIGGPSATCSTRSRSRAWSTRWRPIRASTRSSSGIERMATTPKARKVFETMAQMCD